MAYVNLPERPTGLMAWLADWYGRRRFGRVTEPVQAVSHHHGVMVAAGLLETTADWGWRRLPPGLGFTAAQATAGAVGCSWCIDYGHYEGLKRGQDWAKIRSLPTWRSSAAYSDAERTVLEFAEAVSATPSTVDDDLVRRLHVHFTDQQIVELAAWVALENYRSRFNAALGLRSQGFSDGCRIPDSE